MKLIYTVTAEHRRQGQLIYDSALAPMRWWTAIAEPFTFVALGLGVYYYTTGSWILAISLFASFAYLFSKGFLLRSIGNLLTGRTKSEPHHYQLETGNSGIAFSTFRWHTERRPRTGTETMVGISCVLPNAGLLSSLRGGHFTSFPSVS